MFPKLNGPFTREGSLVQSQPCPPLFKDLAASFT